jgi:hypothetical protein
MMNPGVAAILLSMIAVILLLTGWGANLCKEMGLSPGRFAVLLSACLLLSFVDMGSPLGVWNPGGLCFLFSLTVLAWRQKKRITHGLQLFSCVCTIASVELIFMTWVPNDPAMFLVDEKILYPLLASVISVVFFRSPLSALTGGVLGIFLACVIDPVIRFHLPLPQIVWADGDTRDLMAATAMGNVCLTHVWHTVVQFVRSRLLTGKESYERGTS